MMQDSNLIFYSLFYYDYFGEKFVNLRTDQEKAIKVYLACASVQKNLMEQLGLKYQVITNSIEPFYRSSFSNSYVESCRVEIFDRDVPLGIPFRSAHFKLDVIRAFGEGRLGKRPSLIDLDVLPVNHLQTDEFFNHDLLIYDITDQMVSDIGSERLVSDLSFLLDRPIYCPVWYGGEFISGSQEAFSALSKKIDKIWPRYRDNLDRFAHVGDETIVTAAIYELVQEGLQFRDLGAANLLARWWSARTTFPQSSLSAIANVPFWHLPADKEFIANLDEVEIGVGELQARYAAYVAPRLKMRRSANPFLNLLRNERKHVARLS